MAGKIFINYRRDDSPGMAGRIYDRLAQHFPKRDLFMDVDAMEPGVDFVRQLEEQVTACDVLIAVIGPTWLDARDAKTGERRLDDVLDFVRVEIAAALHRDIRVIPALLQGVSMPQANELPEDLQTLIYRHAVSIRHESFGADTQKLIAACKSALDSERERRRAEKREQQKQPGKGISAAGIAAVAFVGAIMIGGVAYVYHATQLKDPVPAIAFQPAPPTTPPSLQDRIDEALRRAHNAGDAPSAPAPVRGEAYRPNGTRAADGPPVITPNITNVDNGLPYPFGNATPPPQQASQPPADLPIVVQAENYWPDGKRVKF
jgi:hypothetical protein